MKFQKKETVASKHFLALKDGDKIKGVFRGDPYETMVHWTDKVKNECTGPLTCEICKTGEKPKFRFRINFISKEAENYTAKIWEQGKRVYNQLEALNNSYELEKTVMEIVRHGSDTKTIYTIVPLPPPNGQVDPEKEKKLSTIPLHDLENIDAVEASVSANSYGDDVPF